MLLGASFVLRRLAAGVVLLACLGCPSLWGMDTASPPRILPILWQQTFSAQVSGLDIASNGQTIALTVVPFVPNQGSHLYVFDGTGRELWSVERDSKILNVSLSKDGQYIAIGLADFAISLFSSSGTVLWERQGVGLPQMASSLAMVVASQSGIGGPTDALLEAFHLNGDKAWHLHRPGRVWRMLVSDRGDVLLGLWNGEVLLIDRHQQVLWQQRFVRNVMALTISPEDAQYVALGTGMLGQELVVNHRSGRLVWRHRVPFGVTELSLAKQGAFLLSYGNTIRGQHLTLYTGTGQPLWTYHLKEPASESSKGVLVPDAPLAVAGIERDGKFSLQGFSLRGELLWVAQLPEPIFDFRVSDDGRYIAAASDSTLFFFETQPLTDVNAQLP